MTVAKSCSDVLHAICQSLYSLYFLTLDRKEKKKTKLKAKLINLMYLKVGPLVSVP